MKIDEKSSNSPEHPNVARDLFELAQLYQVTNRMTEAEPRMRRAVVIRLKSTRASGHPLPAHAGEESADCVEAIFDD